MRKNYSGKFKEKVAVEPDLAQQVQTGMTVSEVNNLLGCEGDLVQMTSSSAEYKWEEYIGNARIEATICKWLSH